MEVKIKVILILFFLLVFLPGCLPPKFPIEDTADRSERHFSEEEGERLEHSGSSSEADQREVIRIAQEERIAKGQQVVEVNIQYLKDLKKNNERILQSRAQGVDEPSVSEAQKKKLQKAAKDRHFENLEKLLELE